MKQSSTFSLERLELKFTIPFSMIASIRDFIKPYCEPDEYSKRAYDGFYTINNLYLDTPYYLLLKKRIEDAEDRFNLRIRTYGEDGDSKAFLEIKRKSCGVIKKKRAAAPGGDWQKMFDDFRVPSGIKEGKTRENINSFLYLVQLYNAAPKVQTQYRRMAFFSVIDSYARVTFDTDLKYIPEESYDARPNKSRMIPYDETNLYDSGCSVVLELKCEAKFVPFWMIDLIRHFNLTRRNFSKYMYAARELILPAQFDDSRESAFYKQMEI